MPLYSYTTRQIAKPYGSVGLTSAFLAYTAKVRSTATENLIAYWPLAETGGSVAADESGNGRTGAYTGVDLNQTGIGDGRLCPLWDGVNDYCNIYSSSLSTAFSVLEGSIAIWAEVANVGVWTDATARRMIRLSADANNLIHITRQTTSNQIQWSYQAGGTGSNRTKSSLSTTGWFHLAITWSKSADQVKAYYNGIQEGATLTGLGVWAGALGATTCHVGSSNTGPSAVWSGTLAHAAIWTRALTATEVASLASVSA